MDNGQFPSGGYPNYPQYPADPMSAGGPPIGYQNPYQNMAANPYQNMAPNPYQNVPPYGQNPYMPRGGYQQSYGYGCGPAMQPPQMAPPTSMYGGPNYQMAGGPSSMTGGFPPYYPGYGQSPWESGSYPPQLSTNPGYPEQANPDAYEVQSTSAKKGKKVKKLEKISGCGCIVPVGSKCKHLIMQMKKRKPVVFDDEFENEVRTIYQKNAKQARKNMEQAVFGKCKWAYRGRNLTDEDEDEDEDS